MVNKTKTGIENSSEATVAIMHSLKTDLFMSIFVVSALLNIGMFVSWLTLVLA